MKSTKRCHKKGLNKAMLRPPPPSAFVVEREGIKPKFLLPSYAAASIRSDSILCATACAKMAAGSLFSSSRNSSSMCAAWWVSLCTSFIRSSSSEANKLFLCFSTWFSNQSNTMGDSIEWGKIHFFKHQVAPVSILMLARMHYAHQLSECMRTRQLFKHWHWLHFRDFAG